MFSLCLRGWACVGRKDKGHPSITCTSCFLKVVKAPHTFFFCAFSISLIQYLFELIQFLTEMQLKAPEAEIAVKRTNDPAEELSVLLTNWSPVVLPHLTGLGADPPGEPEISKQQARSGQLFLLLLSYAVHFTCHTKCKSYRKHCNLCNPKSHCTKVFGLAFFKKNGCLRPCILVKKQSSFLKIYIFV